MAGPYNYRGVLVYDRLGGALRLVRNGKVTVRDATGIPPTAAGTGPVLTTLTSDEDGAVTYTHPSIATVDLVSPLGFVSRETSPDSFAEASTAAADAASSAASAASSASSAASSAALVGAPAGTAIDAHIGPTYVASGAADERAALNSFLAAAGTGIRRVIGSLSVSDVITIPAGMTVDLRSATITQTGSSKRTLSPGAGATIIGGTLIGKGTDYVAGTNVSPSAVGIYVAAANVTVSGTTMQNHGGAGIYLVNAAGFRAENCTIVGLGSPTIPALDSACFGVYINGGCTGMAFSGMDISATSIGFISSIDTSHLTISRCKVHDIPGQHGFYLQNGTGLNLTGVDAWNINLNGVKLQLNSSVTADCTGTALSNITAINCGDTGVTVNSVDTALTYKWRALSISNVSSVNCSRGLYLGSIRTGTVTGISVYNTTDVGITFVDSQRVALSNVSLDAIAKTGIRFTGVTNGSNDGITISNLRTHNTGNANPGAGNMSGVYVNQCANLTINGWTATANNGFVDYTMFFASTTAAEQQGFVLRNADLSGANSGYEIRLMAGPVAVKEFDNIKLGTNQVLNYPSALVTRVGSLGVNTVYQSNAIPSGGTYKQGDICWNSAAAAAGTPGWYCTAAPSTWKAMAAISA